MLWFYRQDDSVRLVETRYDAVTSEYVLVLHKSDGERVEERFPSAERFATRLEQLEDELDRLAWQRDGPPVILPVGWKSKHPFH